VACRDASADMSVLEFQAGKDFAADWDAGHKQHEDRLAAPDGFTAWPNLYALLAGGTGLPSASPGWR